jgi:proliferating cell nuclear antigen PCNA
MSEKIIDITTTHTIPFKTLIEVLKENLIETVFEITGSEKNSQNNDDTDDEETEQTEKSEQTEKNKQTDNGGGIKIAACDNTKTIFINIRLYANEFTKFICKEKVVNIGVKIEELSKMLKNLEKDEILNMYIYKEEIQYLYLNVYNSDKKVRKSSKLKLMDINKTNFKIPQTKFDAKINFNTNDFHKICRDMNQTSEHIEIKCTPNTITFSCSGDMTEQQYIYQPDDKNNVSIKFDKNAKQIVQGIYELKNLMNFTKNSNLCNDITIYMKNNYPLCIHYRIASLGKMLVCISPYNTEIGADNYSDDDENYDDDNVKYKK